MNLKKIQEHLSTVFKHWIVLMSGIASVAISVFEESLRITGIPRWVFLMISAICFFAAFHRAWLDKDKELLAKEKELQASLGSAPEVVIEWQCGKKNPLMLHNLRGSTEYHAKIRDVIIKGDRIRDNRCTAKFEEVSHIPEGTSVGILPFITDKFVDPQINEDKWKAIKDDFTHVLEAAYQTWGHDFDPVHLALFMDYNDRNGRRYSTVCNIEFDRFKETATVTCEPPKPVATDSEKAV
jgi:hypothetical protein